MFTQFCGVLVFRVSKRTGVAVISRLKLALCMSYVSFLLVCVISGNCCLVNHVCCWPLLKSDTAIQRYSDTRSRSLEPEPEPRVNYSN